MSEEDEEIMLKAIIAYKAERKRPRRRASKPVISKYHVVEGDPKIWGREFRYSPEKRRQVQDNLAKRRALRKEQGLCRECGTKLTIDDLSRCRKCKDRHNVRQRNGGRGR